MNDAPVPPSSSGAAMDRRIEVKSRRRWRLPAGIAAAIAALLLAWRLIPASGSTDIAAADIETGTVTRAPFADYLPVRATVAPAVTTFVTAISGGAVDKLLVQDGSMVAAGQPLATLDNPSLKLDILTREASIAAQLGTVSGDELTLRKGTLDRAAQTSAANYDLIKARRDLSVQQQLHDQGFVSDAGVASYSEQKAYQEKRLAQLRSGESSENGIAALQARRLSDTRTRLSSNLAAVQGTMDDLVLRAPVGGRLTNFTVQPGQMLKAGDQAGQVDSEGQWKLTADVDEYYLGRVRVGQPATGDGGAKLIVTRVLPAVTNGRFTIWLGFVGTPPAGLNRGQTMDARVTLGATRAALVAPVGGWLDTGGGTSAFVFTGTSHAERRPIHTGQRNAEQAEILSGLKPGDRIVTSSLPNVKGESINVR